MKIVHLERSVTPFSGTIDLPSSKSISNRLLVIRSLSGHDFPIQNLSSADDTRVLISALLSNESTVNVGHAGTAMRFLAALAAVQQREVLLTGSARMCARPIAPLVDALRGLGADIRYVDREGYPPLYITPAAMSGGRVSVNGSVSSQYISALMMIGPGLGAGLEIQITGQVVSTPYIGMTEFLMEEFGAKIEWIDSNTMSVGGQYHPRPYPVEADWSAAAFWFEWVALSEPGSKLLLRDLCSSGIQGDEIAQTYFRFFGVESEVLHNGMLIRKMEHTIQEGAFIDLTDAPDLAPALAATMAGLKVRGRLDGLQTLAIKESNRILALKTELEKTGAIIQTGDDYIEFLDFENPPQPSIQFETYDDHRMAMALAPLIARYDSITIRHPEVVSKSYPEFWDNAAKCCTVRFEEG